MTSHANLTQVEKNPLHSSLIGTGTSRPQDTSPSGPIAPQLTRPKDKLTPNKVALKTTRFSGTS